MKKLITAAVAAGVVVVLAAPALAHVTVQPNEAIIGSFSRFVVRVPNERDDASTTKVTLELPPLAFVSFEPKDGWKRTQKTVEFDEPLDVFGEEVTEGVGEVTWSGGEVAPGEFQEFGFSARMPDGEETLTFNAVQTYSSGEVVEWTGAPDSETPAAQLNVYDIGAEEGEGQLAVLARVAADDGDSADAADDEAEDDDDDGSDSLGLILGGIGIALGLVRDSHGFEETHYLMRRLIVGLVVVAGTLLPATAANAHAQLIDSTPKEGAKLDAVPETIRLEFSEPPISGDDLVVADGCGNDVVARAEANQPKKEIVATLAAAQPGDWEVSSRVVSTVDGHPTEDGFKFTVAGEPDCSTEAAPPPREEEEGSSSVGLFLVLGLGTAVVVGVALFVRKRS